MAKSLVRELTLLTLPVILFGGVALVRSSSGMALANKWGLENPFLGGPLRLEHGEFTPVAVQPMDVELGYTWAVNTQVLWRGHWSAPTGWTKIDPPAPAIDSAQLVYKWGKEWKVAPQLSGRYPRVISGVNFSTQVLKIKANLSGIPRQATEVRLRGRIKAFSWYYGPLPKGFTLPQGTRSMGMHHGLPCESQLIDIPIKGPDSQLPTIKVSREPYLSFVKAYRPTHPNWSGIYLQIRRKPIPGNPNPESDIYLLDSAVRDRHGKKVQLCSRNGQGPRININDNGTISPISLHPTFPKSDVLHSYLTRSAACGGWQSHQGPYTLEVKISNGGQWPLTIKIPIQPRTALNKSGFPFQ